MSNVAIIPARSGSKGIKDKNIADLNGKPLIAYTIISAINSGIFDNIIVSTDSEKYAEIAQHYGAEVPFIREKSLALDNSQTSDVIIDILQKNMDINTFCLLQPTSPFRTSNHIVEGFELFKDNNFNPIISVTEASDKIELVSTLNEDHDMNNFLSDNISTLRQDYKKYYKLNGALYFADRQQFLKNRTFFTENSKAYIMDKLSSIDIDEPFDLWLANHIAKDKLL